MNLSFLNLPKGKEHKKSESLLFTCCVCNRKSSNPVVLKCLHVFDRECLLKFEKLVTSTRYVECPMCQKVAVGRDYLSSFDSTKIIQIGPSAGGDINEICSVCRLHPACGYCFNCKVLTCMTCNREHRWNHQLVAEYNRSSLLKTGEPNVNTREAVEVLKENLPDRSVGSSKFREYVSVKLTDGVDKWSRSCSSLKGEILQLNRFMHKDMEGRVLGETGNAPSAFDEGNFVKKCYQTGFSELEQIQQNCMSDLLAVRVKTNLAQKDDFKEPSNEKDTDRANIGEFRLSADQEATLESKSLTNETKYESNFAALNLSENTRYCCSDETPPGFPIYSSSHLHDSKTKPPLGCLGEKTVGAALLFKPIQASQTVDNCQLLSSVPLQPDYYDPNKTGVFALRGDETPSSIQMYAVTRAACCSRLKFLGVTLSSANRRGKFQCAFGFCRGWDGQIVVADGYNHCILVYSRSFKLVGQFGVAGKADGQLWRPRRVAVTESQRYVVCDKGQRRWRLQIFTPNGHFVRTIRLQSCDVVASVVADGDEILVIDSAKSKVLIFSEDGRMLRHLDCSFFVREPSAMIAYEDKYYICDYKGHRVIVMDKEGGYKRSFGGEGLTDYPSGIEISSQGDVLVSDSHANSFHVVLFDQMGSPMQEFVMKDMRMSYCCGLALTEEGHVVTLSRNMGIVVFDTLYTH